MAEKVGTRPYGGGGFSVWRSGAGTKPAGAAKFANAKAARCAQATARLASQPTANGAACSVAIKQGQAATGAGYAKS